MPTQDDDSEEVSLNSLRDVMAVMTRRFEHLLIKQEKRQVKLFAELFDDSVVGVKRAEDLPDQKMLRDETAAWIPEDGILVHLARNETVPTMACIPISVQQAKSEPRQRPSHDDGKTMREAYLPSETAANNERWPSEIAAIFATRPTEHLLFRNLNKGGLSASTKADCACWNCGKTGHHFAVCRDRSKGPYRHGDVAYSTPHGSASYGPRRTAVGVG